MLLRKKRRNAGLSRHHVTTRRLESFCPGWRTAFSGLGRLSCFRNQRLGRLMKADSRYLAVVLFMGLFFGSRLAIAETALERGAYLVEGIAACGNCHAPQEPS